MYAPLKPLVAVPILLSGAHEYQPDYTHHPLVKQVICKEGRGSAFRVGKTSFLSVSHVTNLSACTINGQPITATEEPGDFSTVEADLPRSPGLKINCGGFKEGEWVWAIGYAKGLPWQQTIPLKVTGKYHPSGMAMLWGYPQVIPGMSGGAVINRAGEVVGTVNAYNRFFPLSFSRELKDTSVCKGIA